VPSGGKALRAAGMLAGMGAKTLAHLVIGAL